MKSLLLVVLLLFTFHLASVLARECRLLEEYAELKDTSSKDLIDTYCRYKALSDIEAETLNKLRELNEVTPQGVQRKSLDKSMADHRQTISECLEMQIKIRSALRNRSEPDQPSCDKGSLATTP
jgi:hypothetical protein